MARCSDRFWEGWKLSIKTLAIVGGQWGDEGKGKIVDCLSARTDAVVRFQGGHNAGHTLVSDGRKVIVHLIPAGVLHQHVRAFIGNGVVVSLEALQSEVRSVENHVEDVSRRLAISEDCALLLPSHAALDQARELSKGKRAIGTTSRGIGPAYEDKIARRGIKMHDLLDHIVLTDKVADLLDYHNFLLRERYAADQVDTSEILDFLLAAVEWATPMIADVSSEVSGLINEGKRVLFEGAQGVMLDIDHGTYPYVTSSNTGTGAISTGGGIPVSRVNHIMAIVKAYTTRVGAGPFPTELRDETGNRIAQNGAEFGATTGRPRRCGWFDAVTVRRAHQLNHFDGLCVTKLDVLDGIDSLRICTGYHIGGGISNNLSCNAKQLQESVPIYDEFPGWKESTYGVTRYADLPPNAKNYLEGIAELTGVPIDIISTGPERKHTIFNESVSDWA